MRPPMRPTLTPPSGAPRSPRPPGVHGALGALLATALLLTPGELHGQDPDFLFGTPRVSVALHGGYFQAGAEGEVFDFTTDRLTVSDSDFDTPFFRFEVGIRVAPRFDLAVELGWSKAEMDSETRDFIGTDDLPITQTTSLSQLPFTLSGKYYLRSRGRSIGRFAWIPNGWSPYLGGGIGIVHYEFRQRGEFVVEETLEIVNDDLESEATGGLAQLLAGVEISAGPRFLFVVDGRYRWADAAMRDDWSAFEDIDLSGFQLSLGVGVRL